MSVTLSGTATAANLKSDFTANNNTVQRGLAHQAQFLVSASQSYGTNDLIALDAVNLSASTLHVDHMPGHYRWDEVAFLVPTLGVGTSCPPLSSSCVERVVEALYDYPLRIDDIRGAGRLYLP